MFVKVVSFHLGILQYHLSSDDTQPVMVICDPKTNFSVENLSLLTAIFSAGPKCMPVASRD